jgi:hypothetical protein
MKTLELLETYTETTNLIQNWYKNKMIESFSDKSVPEDFKEMMRSAPIDNDRIAKMIDGAPRLLFDFFDENEIIITTSYNKEGWLWSINNNNNYSVLCNDRKEAEHASIEEAFEILNNKLTEI